MSKAPSTSWPATRARCREVLQRFDVSDDDAFAIGLSCGGVVDVYVERVDQRTFPEFGDIANDMRAERPVAVATLINDAGSGGRVRRRLIVRSSTFTGSFGGDRLDAAVGESRSACSSRAGPASCGSGPTANVRGDDIVVFVATNAPRSRIVFAAIDFAAAVARVDSFLGYRVTVCDVLEADEVIVEWPHRYLAETSDVGEIDERMVVCILTRDTTSGVPLLELALRMPLARTHSPRWCPRRCGTAARQPRPGSHCRSQSDQ